MKNRLLGLDALRGVAALMVFAGHSATMLGSRVSAGPAVDLFFMISGFVIPYAYERKLQRGMTFAQFFEARMLRLYPLYIAGVATSVAGFVFLAAVRGPMWLKGPAVELPWAVLLLPQPHLEPEHSFLLNPPAWTLFLEIVINAAYAWASPRLTTRVVGYVTGISAAALLLAVIHFGTIDFGTGGLEMIWGLARVTCPFSIGVLLYRLWRAEALPRWTAPAWVPTSLYLATTLLPDGLAGQLGCYLAITLGFPVLIVLAINSAPVGVSARVAYVAGEASYPLYALHIPLLATGWRVGFALGRPGAAAVVTAMLLVPPLVLAAWKADRAVRARLSEVLALRRRDTNAAPAL